MSLIHYVDEGELYSIYGVTTLIVVLMLIWYFIRTNIECKIEGLGGIPIEDPDLLAFMPEFHPEYEFTRVQISDPKKPLPYKFTEGLYGDVPLAVYDVADIAYKPEWNHNGSIYVPNMRTIFRQTYTPIEASFW